MLADEPQENEPPDLPFGLLEIEAGINPIIE